MNKLRKPITNWIIKYNDVLAPAKATVWFLVCSIIQKCFSLISTPIFTRILSIEQYGMVANFNSWYELLFPMATLYITGVAYNNIMVQHDDDIESATLSVMILTTVVSLILLLIYLVGKDFFSDITGVSTFMTVVMFIQFVFSPIKDFWAARERFQYRYKKLVAVTLFITIFGITFGVATVLLSEYKYELRIISQVIAVTIVGVVIYVKQIKKVKRKINVYYWKYALKISVPLIPHMLSMKFLNQADRVMITNMIGAEATGVYSLAYTVATLILVVTDAINSSICPYIYKCIKSKQINNVKEKVNIVVLCVLTLTICEMLVAPEIISLMATEEYMSAIYVIPPVALSVIFIFIYVIFSNIEFYYEKTVFASIVSVIAALINIVLNYIFIKQYGYQAAGYTTLVCYILFAFTHYLNYRRTCKINPVVAGIYDTKQILKLSILGIIMMFLCLLLYRWIIVRYVVLFGFIFLFIFLIHKLRMKKNI